VPDQVDGTDTRTDATTDARTDATTDAWTHAWVAALDELELDLVETERLLTAPAVSVSDVQQRVWTAPTHLGPLPDSLLDRARAVNTRQMETARRLALALGATRREQDLNHRLSPFAGSATPVYVDHLM
jgi:hypothetical protein